jgi:predicted aspartyl protease
MLAGGSAWAQNTAHVAHLTLAYDRPIVRVMVNEKGPFRFLVDTGSNAEAFLTPNLARRLNLQSTGERYITDASGQGVRAPIVSIKSVRVAGVEFAAVKAIIYSFDRENVSFDGILGLALFRDYLLTLNFPKRELTLTSGALLPDGGQRVLPFSTPRGLPAILLRIGHSTIDAEIDSGGAGLTLPQGFASRQRYFYAPGVFAVEQTVSRRFELGGAILTSHVEFGNYSFSRPFVEIDPGNLLANFGSTAMRDFALTFDQRNCLVLFEARKKSHGLDVPPMARSCALMAPSC